MVALAIPTPVQRDMGISPVGPRIIGGPGGRGQTLGSDFPALSLASTDREARLTLEFSDEHSASERLPYGSRNVFVDHVGCRTSAFWRV